MKNLSRYPVSMPNEIPEHDPGEFSYPDGSVIRPVTCRCTVHDKELHKCHLCCAPSFLHSRNVRTVHEAKKHKHTHTHTHTHTHIYIYMHDFPAPPSVVPRRGINLQGLHDRQLVIPRGFIGGRGGTHYGGNILLDQGN
jgi:hypothetical protein